MNSLSWMIYLASVTDAMRENFGSLLGITVFATVMLSIGAFLAKILEDVELPFYRTYMKVAVPVMVVSFVFCNILPKKETLMLIAASEFGDRIMTQQKIGERIVDPSITLLQEWIKKQTEEITAGKKK